MRPLRSSGPDSSERHARLTRATSRASGDRRSWVETASHLRSPPTLPHRLPVRLDLLGRRGDRYPAPAQGPPRGLPCFGSAAGRKPPPAAHRPPGRERRLLSDPGPTSSRFDLRASSYEDSVLQEFLFVPVQQAALQLGRRFLPQAGRILDVGCGTGRLLRSARRCYPGAELVGVDLAGRMAAAAIAVTPTRLAVRYGPGARPRWRHRSRGHLRQLPAPESIGPDVASSPPHPCAGRACGCADRPAPRGYRRCASPLVRTTRRPGPCRFTAVEGCVGCYGPCSPLRRRPRTAPVCSWPGRTP